MIDNSMFSNRGKPSGAKTGCTWRLAIGSRILFILTSENKKILSMTMHEMTLQILGILREGTASADHIVVRLNQENDGKDPSLATFYRHLKIGLDNGWIAIAGEAQAGRGRPQQSYRVTDAGVEAAAIEARRLRALADLALGKTRAL